MLGAVPWSRLPTADATGDERQPVALPAVLDAVLAGLGAPSTDAIVAIHEQWEQIIGPELVAHAEPAAIEDGCLRITVDSPAWAGHLRWSEAEIVGRIDRLLGPGVVTSVTARAVRPGRRS
jgi:predicted nucleic acid-binding Zn ribbon protein